MLPIVIRSYQNNFVFRVSCWDHWHNKKRLFGVLRWDHIYIYIYSKKQKQRNIKQHKSMYKYLCIDICWYTWVCADDLKTILTRIEKRRRMCLRIDLMHLVEDLHLAVVVAGHFDRCAACYDLGHVFTSQRPCNSLKSRKWLSTAAISERKWSDYLT